MLKQLIKHKKLIIIFLVIVGFLIFVKERGFKRLSENFENANLIDVINGLDIQDQKLNDMIKESNATTVTFNKKISTNKDIDSTQNILAGNGSVKLGADGTIYAKSLKLENGITQLKKDGWKKDTKMVMVEKGGWGSWQDSVDCPDGYYVCGIQTRFEGSQGNRDDTALNGIQMKCCKF